MVCDTVQSLRIRSFGLQVDDGDFPRVSTQRSSVSVASTSALPKAVSPPAAPPPKRLRKFKPTDVRSFLSLFTRSRPRRTHSLYQVKVELLQDIATLYLANTATLGINPPPNDVYVPRWFLRENYGGSDQQFLATFHPNKGADRHRRVVFPQAELNPFLPRAPGAPGLIFASRMEIVEDPTPPTPPWALFLKDDPTGKTVWRYMGDYRNRRCGSLTAEQFKSQTLEVKHKWARLLLGSRKHDVYVAMRARIALRKAGVAVIPGDAVEAREMKLVKAERKGKPPVNAIDLNEQDIVAALSRGDETIDIIQLECVSYDHAFVAELARRYATKGGVGRQVKPRKSTGSNKAKSKSNAKGKGKAKQAPAADSDNESGSAFAPESEDSDWESNQIQPRPRRQKKQDVRLSPELGSPTPQLGAPSRSRTPKLGSDESMSDLTELSNSGSEEV
ncbi:hypothetical protein B0H16DRAFT_1339519 [Mycena metata]|uniref:DUF6697 domain-containing protein n=1 Tax=Mycena metata TaxID=1033252 RepID=A0AAD7MGH0_9AGAR|nr:hypothetical protein B0H16DRAFT_1339519 [Mycena metata]